MKAKIKYYGVRGSTPTTGKDFNRYGGNTTCVFIEANGQKIIIDAGTGIRQLGIDLMKTEFAKGGGEINILFTHTHWDHIQGFPFFIPAFLPNNKINIYGETKNFTIKNVEGVEVDETWDIERTLYMQQSFMFFPVTTHYMGADIFYEEIKAGKSFMIGDIKIHPIHLFHPNNTIGFRFDFGKSSFVFCTDVEHNDEMKKKIVKLAKNADILAYDCQYTPEEYKTRSGWGHSTYEEGIEICKKANVKHLHMIHHEPMHNDDKLDEIQNQAQKLFKKTIVVPEGLTVEI